ncbi:hypothetical protein [Streptomyces sp. CB02959]|uniref:hypothetical protein n=1 Tax=Streptomyces sp. CB02959 TaxID=2020330 RepID=UPI0015E08981|nr:hypothetical protein [Streptomyces sp. CB02959]
MRFRQCTARHQWPAQHRPPRRPRWARCDGGRKHKGGHRTRLPELGLDLRWAER